MARKNEIVIEAQDNDFGAVLICAVRYSIGRQTYMPGLVTDWIKGHCNGKLDGNTIAVLKRDIDRPPCGTLGDDCDVRTWMNFRRWLDTQGEEQA